ncbi:hypothetical protein M8C21_004045, partial [Ambrosia artemisiifolia]
ESCEVEEDEEEYSGGGYHDGDQWSAVHDGAGSTPIHYAVCGGSAQCCQYLISRGASLTAKNAKGWTPLAVAHSWNRDWLEEVLVEQPHIEEPTSSPYLCLPLMSVVSIASNGGGLGFRQRQRLEVTVTGVTASGGLV